jgi:hypothetical protein
MKHFLIFVLLNLLIIFSTSRVFSQIWPFYRYGVYSFYYKIDNVEPKTSSSDNSKIEKDAYGCFFDILAKNDSIQMMINGKREFFKQKNTEEPSKKRLIPFYSRRKITNSKATILYLKFKGINDSLIVAEAKFKYNSRHAHRKKEMVEIKRDEIKGLFIGPPKIYRRSMTILVYGCIGLNVLLL